MSLLAHLDYQIRASEEPVETRGPLDDFWYNEVMGGVSDSGIRISPQQAMRIATVFKCIRWKGAQYGKLPKKIYRRAMIEGHWGRDEAPDHPLFNIVHRRPNPEITSFNFFEQVSMDLDQEGNFYAYIQRDALGRPKYLWRLLPDAGHMEIRTRRVEDTGAPGGRRTELRYVGHDADGEETTFYPDEILHVRGMGFDGIRGYKPIAMMMNNLGWHRATIRYGAQFFKNASRPSGLLIAEHGIKDPKAKAELIANLSASGKGAGALKLIEGGIKYTKMSLDQDEAQFLETLEYQDEDICGIFEVKPHKVGIMRHMTNNNVEQQNIEAATDCLHPLSERIEQWFDHCLLTEEEQEEFFMESELKALMRGDSASRATFYQTMKNIAAMNANEIRLEENMRPYKGGDMYTMQLNLAPVEAIAAMKFEDGKPSKPDQGPAEKAADEEKEKRFQATHLYVWTDAVRRTVARKKASDRQRTAAQTFYFAVASLSAALGIEALNVTTLSAYLETLALRAAEWDDETQAQAIAVTEFHRATNYLKGA